MTKTTEQAARAVAPGTQRDAETMKPVHRVKIGRKARNPETAAMPRAPQSLGASRAAQTAALQRSMGNQFVGRTHESQEPRVQRECSCGGTCSECAGQAQRAAANTDAAEHGAPIEVAMPGASTGEPMGGETRDYMESRFNRGFDHVRVHHDAPAAKSADTLQANAYAYGNDIYFAAGKYQPETPEGKALLAHELAHTVQQQGASTVQRAPGDHVAVSRPGDASEREAERVASQVTAEKHPGDLSPAAPALRRDPQKTDAPVLQYKCDSADLVGDTLTFHGNGGDLSVHATVTGATPGVYHLMRGAGGSLNLLESTVSLGKYWTGRLTKSQRQIHDGYVANLSQPVPLTVHDAHAGKQSGSQGQPEGSHGTGAGGAGDESKGGSEGASKKKGEGTGGGSEAKQEGQAGGSGATGGKQEGQTGGTGGSGTKQQGQTSSGQGGTGGATGPDVYAKLQSILDSPTPPKLTPGQEQRLRAILDQMSPDDIALFKKTALKNPSGDPELLIKSLQLFLDTKSQFEKQKAPAEPAEVSDEANQALAEAIQQFRPDMSQEQKENLAAAAIRSVSNKQLKNLSAADVAKSLLRVDQQVKGMANDMSSGLDDAIKGTGWESVAGVARTAKGAASFWALLSFAALIAAAFIPGLNVLVLEASAMASLLVTYAAANIEEAASIKAAGKAQTPDQYAKWIVSGSQARTEALIMSVAMALPIAGAVIRRIPMPAGVRNAAAALKNASGILKKAGGTALENSRSLALDALRKFRAELHPYSAQVRQSLGSLAQKLRGAQNVLKMAESMPELQELLPPDTVKALEGLSASEQDVAKNAILSGVDNAPAITAETFDGIDAHAAEVEQRLEEASSPEDLQKALDDAVKTTEGGTSSEAGQEAVGKVVEHKAKANDQPGKKPVPPAGDLPKDYVDWENTLSPDTQQTLRENPDLRQAFIEMDPEVRNMLTLCESPCIPTDPVPTPADVKRIGGMLKKFKLPGNDKGLREYFHRRRDDLSSAIDGVEDAKDLKELRSRLNKGVADMAAKRGIKATLRPDGRWEAANSKGVKVTEYDVGPYKDLPGSNSFFQRHHGIQGEWGEQRLGKLYDYDKAPTIQLRDSHTGTPHQIVTDRQAGRLGDIGVRTYDRELQLLKDDMAAAGVPQTYIDTIVNQSNSFFADIYNELKAIDPSKLKDIFGTWKP